MTKILRAIAGDPFLEGFARALDIFGNISRPMPYERRGGPEADLDAIRRDWEAVGGDIRSGMQKADRMSQEDLIGTT